MELSKHIPINFEVGDLVLLIGVNPDIRDRRYWDDNHDLQLARILEINWGLEQLAVTSPVHTCVIAGFSYFKLIKKNCKLVKLIL